MLASQRDHYMPLRVIRRAPGRAGPRAGAAGAPAGAGRAAARAAAGAPCAAPGPAATPRLTPRRSCWPPARIEDDSLAALESYGLVAPAAGDARLLRRGRRSSSPGRRASWRRSASSRGTCARSAARPTARRAWSSRWSPRCAASAARRPRGGRGGRAGRSRRCASGCTPRSSAAVRPAGVASGPAPTPGAVAAAAGYGDGSARAGCRRSPGRDALQQPDRAAARARRRAVPADLGRRRRGQRDRLRPAGRGAAAAADARPPAGRHRGAAAASWRRSGSSRSGTTSSTPSWCFDGGLTVGCPLLRRDRPGAARRLPDRRGRRGARGRRRRGAGRGRGRGREVPRVPRPDLAGGLRRGHGRPGPRS